eukprot:2324288-Rhodomonas_salina.1
MPRSPTTRCTLLATMLVTENGSTDTSKNATPGTDDGRTDWDWSGTPVSDTRELLGFCEKSCF